MTNRKQPVAPAAGYATKCRVLAMLAVVMASPAAAGPLFDSDAPIEVTLTGPIASIVRTASRSTEARPGTLTVGAMSHPVTLAARGLSRRQADVCDFPPIRVTFTAKPSDPSPFRGQEKLKLVTHCRERDRSDDLLLREYAAYRLYNRLTEASFRVRLAMVRYTDESGKLVTRRRGFFIEDIDDVGKRIGAKEVKLNGIARSALDPQAASRVALFQYMIGNLDWTFLRGPAGEPCCHNSKLLARDPARPTATVPVPYDFDYSGLVDAPYAVPPDEVRVRSVKQRRFFGLCPHNQALAAPVAAFRAARPALEAALAEVPDLAPSSRTEMAAYLSSFFSDIRDDATVADKLVDNCR